MEVKYISAAFLAAEQLRTGSDQFMLKTNRVYVGIYDSKLKWFVPLVGKLSTKAPKYSVYDTPFKNNNPHLVKPGLTFQKAIYINDENALLDMKNSMPKLQYEFIESHMSDIENKFMEYVEKTIQLPVNSNNVVMSTVPFYPEGIKKLLGQKVDLFGLEGEVKKYKPELKGTNKLISNVKLNKFEERVQKAARDDNKQFVRLDSKDINLNK